MAVDWVPMVAAAAGGGGATTLVRPLLDHFRNKRRQTDEVAMELVAKLQTRIERLEEAQEHERELCDAKLASLRHELRNVEGNFDALLLAIEVAPEKAAEVVAKIKARRTVSEAHIQRRGEARQTVQIEESAKNVRADKAKG